MTPQDNIPSPSAAPATCPATENNPRRPDIRKLIGDALRYLLPLAVSVGLIVWLFHKTDFDQLKTIIHEECDFRWIALMMGITVLSHVIRGARWGIQLRGVGIPRIPLIAESVSIFGAYALNLLFPNIGELWRITYISRREKTRFSTVLGTDVGDRISDLIVVLLLLGLALIVAHPAIDLFMSHYAVGRDITHIVENPWLWIGIGAALAAVWIVVHFFRTRSLVMKAEKSLDSVWKGFAVLFTMRQRGLYLVLTLGIWACYFLETYVCFMAFPFTRTLIEDPTLAYGLIPGLLTFVFGSCSMAIPSNGGLGPWNLAVMFALSLYGIGHTEGVAYSMVVWGCQAATLVALGLFSAAYILISSRRAKEQKTSQSTTQQTPNK